MKISLFVEISFAHVVNVQFARSAKTRKTPRLGGSGRLAENHFGSTHIFVVLRDGGVRRHGSQNVSLE
jgi:hypothetical protein